jgi:tetrahydromethanopterin S-methyltransferase subunit A
VPGEYFVVSETAPVAVSTLASGGLAEAVAACKPAGLSIIGKTETENIGIDKVIRNVVSNPAIRFLLVVGKDPSGHRSGATLLALAKNGVDEDMRVVGSPGKRPVLANVTLDAVEAFRKQVKVMDLTGCEDMDTIIKQIAELAQKHIQPFEVDIRGKITVEKPVTVIEAKASNNVTLDKAGYFIIIPQNDRCTIVVEQYCYDNRLLREIRGTNARDIYATIIANGWISELSHAAYLGKELEKAELSLKHGFKYVQDGA